MFWIILKLVHVKLGQPACCSVINECLGLHCIWFARILCYITSCTQNFLLCYFSLRLVFVYVLRKSSCCRTLYAHSSHACTNLPKLCSIDKLLCVCVCVCMYVQAHVFDLHMVNMFGSRFLPLCWLFVSFLILKSPTLLLCRYRFCLFDWSTSFKCMCTCVCAHATHLEVVFWCSSDWLADVDLMLFFFLMFVSLFIDHPMFCLL